MRIPSPISPTPNSPDFSNYERAGAVPFLSSLPRWQRWLARQEYESFFSNIPHFQSNSFQSLVISTLAEKTREQELACLPTFPSLTAKLRHKCHI